MLKTFRKFRNQLSQNDESTSLHNDAEAQNSRANRLSFREFSLSEFELSFEMINETFPNLQISLNYESLKVVDCQKFDSALESIPLLVRGFFLRFGAALCLHFVIDDDIGELTEFEFFNFFNSLRDLSKSFVIIFEDEKYNSSVIYWRPKDAFQIFSLQEEENSVKLTDFLKEFLMTCLKNEHNGIHPLMQNLPRNQIKIQTPASLLADDKCMNLLYLAARGGKLELVKFLLGKCDMNIRVDSKIAIDYAYENDQFNVVFFLLNENSRFPRDFDVSDSMPDDLKSFVDMSVKLHEAIEVKCLESVKRIVDESSNLRFFYDTKNRSAMSFALTSKAFNIYRFLMAKSFTLGPHEILKDLLQKLSEDQRDELTEINESMLQNVAEKHILALMSSTQVGPDDKEARLNSVYNALQKLNTIPGIKILLQIVAASRNFQLVFDFKRDHILFLQPAEEGYVTGLFDVCGRIYIGAQHLLNPSKAHEVLGVIAHELCHYVMWIVFKNHAKPYEVKDEVKRVRFEQILEQCKLNSHLEGIVDLAFSQYEEEMHVAELIVRVPHALGLYIDDDEKLEEFRENFTELSNFYDEVVSTMQAKLPEIEEEAENKIRKENSSPLKFLKYHWKKILLLFLLIALSAFFITFLARSCIFKKCGDSRAFCVFEHFTATCKCNDNLHWNASKCFNCLIDDHCSGSDLCFVNNCNNRRNIFDCDNKTRRMFSNSRCNGIIDCDDESDETYHCVYGHFMPPLFDTSCEYFITEPVYGDDNLLFINQTSDECDEIRLNIFMLETLPVNISKTLPDLKIIDFAQASVSKLTFDQLWGLYKLEVLNLARSRLIFLQGAFHDLIALKHLDLHSNGLKQLNDREFDNLGNLEELDLSQNALNVLGDDIFYKLLKLKTLLLNSNEMFSFSDNQFKDLHSLENFDLSRNNIEKVQPKLFRNLTNLKVLSLYNNPIVTLPGELFQYNAKLIYLSLASLKLTSINERTFDNCALIEYLDLSQNELENLPVGTFKNLRVLRNLTLSFNSIKKLEEKTFENTTKLEKLDLSHNNISVISDNLFENLINLRVLIANNNEINALKTVFFRHTLKIEQMNFGDNHIEMIDEDLIDDLRSLRTLDLSKNNCTGKVYDNIDEVMRQAFKQDIKMKCNKIIY